MQRVATYSKHAKLNRDHLRKLCEAGWTDEKIADFFGIAAVTLAKWKQRWPDFAQKMKDWKEEADHKVERSTYEAAMGYERMEEKLFMHEGEIIRAETKRYYPPNPILAIFWLTNRMSGDWKRTRQEQSSDPLSVKVFNLIKQNGNGHGNGKAKKGKDNRIQDAITIDSTVNIERIESGGLEIVE